LENKDKPRDTYGIKECRVIALPIHVCIYFEYIVNVLFVYQGRTMIKWNREKATQLFVLLWYFD